MLALCWLQLPLRELWPRSPLGRWPWPILFLQGNWQSNLLLVPEEQGLVNRCLVP